MNNANEKVENVIEGDLIPRHSFSRIFPGLHQASDFVISFGIRNYAIQDGQTQDGQYVVQVSYQRSM